MYYREAVGAFVVYDVTDPRSFEMVAKWKESLDTHLSDSTYRLPVVLLGNKCDLVHDTNVAMLNEYCKENGFLCWFETSAKENINIDEAVHALIVEIMKTEMPAQAIPRTDIIDPTEPKQQKHQQSACSCS